MGGVMFKKYLALSISTLFMMLAFMNCSSSSSGDAGQAGSPTPATTPQTDPPAGKPNAWDAPVGELISGATLKDGWYDLREISGVNLPGGWTDSAAISRSGLNLYFSYSRFDFADLVENGNPTVSGEARIGMSGNYFKNFRAELTAQGWVVNYLPFNSDPNMHESSIAVNSAESIAAFSRWNSSGSVASLYFTTKDSNGTWAATQQIPTSVQGTLCSNDNPFIVGDLSSGIDIYFESNRTTLACTGSQTEKHIYHTFYNPNNDTFSAITKVAGINGTYAGDDDTQFFITEDKKHAYWTAVRKKPGEEMYAVFTADLVGGAFVNARPVVIPNFTAPRTGKLTFPGEANIVEVPEGYMMYMMCGLATKETGAVHGVHLKICRAKKNKYSNESKKINTTGWSDSPSISRDGQRLYFMYSRWDFAPWIISGDINTLKVVGPDRLGLHQSSVNPFAESDIYMSTKNNDGTWSEPVNVGLNGDFGDASGMEFNNGNSFIWLRGNGSTNHLVIAHKNADGTWGAPIDMGTTINLPASGQEQDNPHISADGNAVWFTSNRSGGQGGKDLWFTAKSGSTWSAPINLDTNFNSSGDQDQFFVPATSNDIYWNGPMGIMHCVSNGSTCSAPATVITIPGCVYPAEVSLPDDQQTMYFACGDLTTGRIKIMFSKKSAGVWGPATAVD